MSKKHMGILVFFSLILLAACGENQHTEAEPGYEELPSLSVDFQLPETAGINEIIELKATVTYDQEPVKDADEVIFEVWKQGDEDNSEMIEAINNEDGTYTAETTFDETGTYELYAHTSARNLHTMPLKQITIQD